MDVLNFKPANPLTSSNKQPWSAVWTPGVNLVNFYNLYDSKGDVTISTPTSIPTTLDGPIQVARYGALTVNAALTASQRCRGLIVLSDSLSMGAAGSVSMTGRGAAGAKNWAVSKDIFIPQSITFTGKNTSYADFLKWIRQTGYCIFDPSLYACPPPGMGDVQCDWATWTPYGSTIISAAGCGGYAFVGLINANGSYGGWGGNAGANAPGGGGVGPSIGANASANYLGRSGKANVWGGGQGQGGANVGGGVFKLPDMDLYGGAGPVGSLPGGAPLIVIVRGAVSLTAGHAITSNGSNATTAYYAGAGGGVAALYYQGSLSGTLNITANGGTGLNGGGSGGAGSAKSATFATMGWS